MVEVIPDVRIIRPSLEVANAECPHCGYHNKFNRRSDLKDLTAIDRKEVLCGTCKKPFALLGDLYQPLWAWLIWDCFELKEEKKLLRYCALNLSQAFEAFFSLYLKVNFLFKPFRATHDTLKLNETSELLYKTTKWYSFKKLRKLFLHYVLVNRNFSTWEEVKLEICLIPDICDNPSDTVIDQLSDPKLAKLLKELKQVKAPELRNKVVHQGVYLPTLEEINSVEEETENLLHSLSEQLKIYGDDLNHYMNESN